MSTTTPGTKRKDLPHNQRGVAMAWACGYSMKSGRMRTDGQSVWSWGLVIGVTRDGAKVALDYRGSVSDSTTRHVGELASVAERFEDPS